MEQLYCQRRTKEHPFHWKLPGWHFNNSVRIIFSKNYADSFYLFTFLLCALIKLAKICTHKRANWIIATFHSLYLGSAYTLELFTWKWKSEFIQTTFTKTNKQTTHSAVNAPIANANSYRIIAKFQTRTIYWNTLIAYTRKKQLSLFRGAYIVIGCFVIDAEFCTYVFHQIVLRLYLRMYFGALKAPFVLALNDQ